MWRKLRNPLWFVRDALSVTAGVVLVLIGTVALVACVLGIAVKAAFVEMAHRLERA